MFCFPSDCQWLDSDQAMSLAVVWCSSERVAVSGDAGIYIRVSWGGDPYRISSERGAVRGVDGVDILVSYGGEGEGVWIC